VDLSEVMSCYQEALGGFIHSMAAPVKGRDGNPWRIERQRNLRENSGRAVALQPAALGPIFPFGGFFGFFADKVNATEMALAFIVPGNTIAAGQQFGKVMLYGLSLGARMIFDVPRGIPRGKGVNVFQTKGNLLRLWATAATISRVGFHSWTMGKFMRWQVAGRVAGLSGSVPVRHRKQVSQLRDFPGRCLRVKIG